MTSRMVDCLYPPTSEAELAALSQQTGAKTLAVYLPGWGATTTLGAPDPTAICKLALSLGWRVHLIGDPEHNALGQLLQAGPQAFSVLVEMMLEWLAKIGADTSSPAGASFDLEEVDFSAGPALCSELASRFCLAGTGHGILPVQYGNPNLLASLVQLPPGQRPEAVWIADYPAGMTAWPDATIYNDPELASLQGLWTFPGQRGWQWHGGIDIGGVNVDLSVIDWPTWGAAPAPAPDPTPAPEPAPANPASQLEKGIAYLTPKGDTLTLS